MYNQSSPLAPFRIVFFATHNFFRAYFFRNYFFKANMSTTKSSPVVLSVGDWNPSVVKFMQPKVNERGGKSISIISGQTNRSLHISTPLLVTWGISDFVDEKTGESDGKYSMSLSFPNDDYATTSTREFLQKLKDFENLILDAAVKNSDAWWGEEMSREVCKHTFFPFLKYSKNKDTKKIDLTKPPSIRAKVPYYDSRWAVEIYDIRSNMLFPCDNPNLTPIDFIPKTSSVACVLQCGGIWIGGKGWGLTWKLIQCIVKPKEVVSVYGKCHIQLSNEEKDTIEKQQLNEGDDIESAPVVVSKPAPSVQAPIVVPVPVPVPTMVQDSDDEQEPPAKVEAVVAPVPTPAPVEEPAAAVVKKTVVKKVVKKA